MALVAAAAAPRASAADAPSAALDAIGDRPDLKEADAKYLAVFAVSGDELTGKDVRDRDAALLGLACWKRITVIVPREFREDIVQFNVQDGRRWAGFFDGDGTNDVGEKGYRFSVAKYVLAEADALHVALRPLTARRGTLDWTLVHEMGHYICLKHDLIERFSQAFDGDTVPQPRRCEKPDDYPADGSPKLTGDFVTSYAERNPGDEETVETFTTFLLVESVPAGESLVARKLRFFEQFPVMRELRTHIQGIGRKLDATRRNK